jgi:hypothetical protein
MHPMTKLVRDESGDFGAMDVTVLHCGDVVDDESSTRSMDNTLSNGDPPLLMLWGSEE